MSENISQCFRKSEKVNWRIYGIECTINVPMLAITYKMFKLSFPDKHALLQNFQMLYMIISYFTFYCRFSY